MSLSANVGDGAMTAAKIAPAATYAGSYAAGADWTVNELAAAAALIYSLIMIGEWVVRRVRAWRHRGTQ